MRCHCRWLLACLLLLLLLLLWPEDAAAATRRSRRKSVSERLSSRLSDITKASALANGMILTSNQWRVRHSYTTNVDDVKLCFNIRDSVDDRYNSSVRMPWVYRNRTVYGLFACPLADNWAAVYCCGDDLAERCCTFWDEFGRVAGVVVGILAGVAFVVYAGRQLHRSSVFASCRERLSDCRLCPSRTTTSPTPAAGAGDSRRTSLTLNQSLHDVLTSRLREAATARTSVSDTSASASASASVSASRESVGAPPAYEEALAYPRTGATAVTTSPPQYQTPRQEAEDEEEPPPAYPGTADNK